MGDHSYPFIRPAAISGKACITDSPLGSADTALHSPDHVNLVRTYQRFSDLRSSSRPKIFRVHSSQNSRRSSMDEPGRMPDLGFSPMTPECADCVPDCTAPLCPAVELTPQCTDQCVVIACTDDSHEEMSCHDGGGTHHCVATCDGNPDCTGFEEFLQCCTDYHSYFSEPKSYAEQPAHHSGPWDSTFDTFLRAGRGESQDAGPNHFTKYYEPEPILQSSSHHDFNNSISASPPHTTFHSQTPFDESSLRAGTSSAPNQQPTCMWSNCNSTFATVSDLLGHVNYQHIRLPFSPSPELPHQHRQLDNVDSLSCLWGDCNIFPSMASIPGPSSGDQVDAALGVLASHLLHDHLGVTQRMPSPFYASTADSSEVITPGSTTSPQPRISEAPHQCSGQHLCSWRSCNRVFMSCDELTSHITSVHIGAGKARYECFWANCDRHGDRGFSSKQKICRHMQSHTGHRPFQCQICQQNFSEAATLQQHMRRHTQEKPYVCDFPGCGKAFAITGALTIHKRTHNGHKPFKCTYCERAFAESSNLSKHLRTHTGVRPYSCIEPNCGKAFARPDQLVRHMRVHRKKVEEDQAFS